MTSKNAIKFLILLLLSAKVDCIDQSIDIKCELKKETHIEGSVTTCEAVKSIEVWSKNIEISSCTTNNGNCKNFEGFTAINMEMFYFPESVDKFFPNLKYLTVNYCQLREIHRNDLKNFTKLLEISLNNNFIEILEENLFEFNTDLKAIFISNNKISSIHPNVFDNLPKLNYLTLVGNPCIDYSSNKNGNLEEIKEKIINCTWKPPNKDSEANFEVNSGKKFNRDDEKIYQSTKSTTLITTSDSTIKNGDKLTTMNYFMDSTILKIFSEESTEKNDYKENSTVPKINENSTLKITPRKALQNSLEPHIKLQSNSPKIPTQNPPQSQAQKLFNLTFIIGVAQVTLIFMIITIISIIFSRRHTKKDKKLENDSTNLNLNVSQPFDSVHYDVSDIELTQISFVDDAEYASASEISKHQMSEYQVTYDDSCLGLNDNYRESQIYEEID